MNLKQYYLNYKESSKIHAKNIRQYGPKASLGYPRPLKEQLERVRFIVNHSQGLVLDVGCDSGYILDRCGGGVGVDISLERLKVAKSYYPSLSLVQAIAERLPFTNGIFDVVVMAELLEHVLIPSTVLVEASEVLKGEGRVVVTVPDEVYGKSHRNPEHLRKFTKYKLQRLIQCYFNVEAESYVRGDYPAWCFLCKKL